MDLLLECQLGATHDDFSVYESVNVGFNDDRQFVILHSVENYDNRDLSYNEMVIVDTETAFKLAAKMNVRLTELPDTFSDMCYRHFPDYECWSLNEIRERFRYLKSILDQYHVRYRTVKARRNEDNEDRL